MESICGIDCGECELKDNCAGCSETKGQPFGAECIVALCCQKGEDALRKLKENLIEAFNGLHIRDMEKVTCLNALKGLLSILNILCRAGKSEVWDDNKIYLGNQLHKKIAIDVMGLWRMKNTLW